MFFKGRIRCSLPVRRVDPDSRLPCCLAGKNTRTSSIPTLKPSLHKKCNVSLLPPQLSSLQRCKCAARTLILCCWALQGYSAVGHCRDIWWLDTAGILCSWAHSVSISGMLVGWALQGYFAELTSPGKPSLVASKALPFSARRTQEPLTAAQKLFQRLFAQPS